MITLRKFEESDWDAYSGCDSENPQIGDMEIAIHNGDHKVLEAEVILDGNVVEIYAVWSAEDGNDWEQYSYQKSLKIQKKQSIG